MVPRWLVSLRYISSSSVICLVMILASVGLIAKDLTTPQAGAVSDSTGTVLVPNTAANPGSSLRTLMRGLPNTSTLKQQTLAEETTLNTTSTAATTNTTPIRQAAVQPRPACGAARPYIYIPSVGLCMNIITVGMDGPYVGVPNNTYQAGWWNQSNWFGTGGTTFVDGHSPGQFSAVKGVGHGTIITIGMTDGRDLSYRVTGTEIVGLDNWEYMMTRALYTPGLNLMTCHGYNDSQRFIVYSTPV